MQNIEQYQNIFQNYLKTYIRPRNPITLYEPANYILDIGGKRLRPVLTLMSAEIFGVSCDEALDAALAIEVFHNFSLIHDDIMDDAPLRRGKLTVHEKWNLNTGILTGDAMLIMAYQCFQTYEPKKFKELISLFTTTALEVCEGQQFDIDFETQDQVVLDEYIKMIAYKTAVLVAAAMKMGAIIANASKEDQEAIYNFGLNLGTAFQLQDDYLDAFGNPESFGKQVGGDILEHKKTYLYLKTIELGSEAIRKEFLEVMSDKNLEQESKISKVKELYNASGAKTATQLAVKDYTDRAFKDLEHLQITQEKKDLLKTFGEQLMNRTI